MMFQVESCYNLSCVLKKCNMAPGRPEPQPPQQASALRQVFPSGIASIRQSGLVWTGP